MILQDLFHNYLAGSYQRSCQDYLAMISPRSCQDLTKVLSKLMECHNRQTMQMLCLSFIFCPFALFAWRESFTHEHAILMPWYFCMNWSCLFALTLTSAWIKITFLTIKRRSVYFINFSSFGWSYIIIDNIFMISRDNEIPEKYPTWALLNVTVRFFQLWLAFIGK